MIMKTISIYNLQKRIKNVSSVSHNSYAYKEFVKNFDVTVFYINENLYKKRRTFSFVNVLKPCYYNGFGKHCQLFDKFSDFLRLLDEIGLNYEVYSAFPEKKSKVHFRIRILTKIVVAS